MFFPLGNSKRTYRTVIIFVADCVKTFSSYAKKKDIKKKEVRMLFPARIELATFRVWGGRDNHYTTETTLIACAESIVDLCNESAKY